MENSPSRFVSDLQQLVREDARSILPCGSTTKSALSRSQAGCLRIDMRPLAGIVAYDPSEFLITARAGTPVGDLMTSLARHGQYLPFDPLFVEAGATVGGTIASGISGPNRLLYGSLRDFVMEVELIDGLGKLVRGGGKVVKNAAGFDIPKMMVGSYGRMGVLTEVTLKVFPAPQALAVMSTQCESLSEAVNVLQQVMAKPFPVNAIHLCPEHRLVLQLAGPDASLGQVQQRVQSVVPRAWVTGNMAEAEQEARRLQAWLEQAPSEQIDGAPSGGEQRALIRCATDPRQLVAVSQALRECECDDYRICSAGSVVWVRTQSSGAVDALDHRLAALGISAAVIVDSSKIQADSPFLGARRWLEVADRIQTAMDPKQRFLSFKHTVQTSS